MPNPLLVDCSHCGTSLLLPPPPCSSICCAVCHRITLLPPPNFFNTNNNINRRRPYPPQYTPSLPNAHGAKKALICGISYRKTRYELRGTLNDAQCIKHLLITKFQFPESSILLLTDDQNDRSRLPTKQNLRTAMRWLVQGCQYGDSLVFHYSGHGSQQRNRNGEEVDNYDETILPLDFKTQGVIVDDEINLTIVRPLPRGVKLHAIIDACHSGTVLDLPFVCKMNSQGLYVWEDQRPPTGTWKGTSGGEAFCFSGCDDNQTSADTPALATMTYTGSATYTGAMTYCFIQAIERGNARTYRDLLLAMRNSIRNADIGNYGGSIISLVERILTGGRYGGSIRQEPQLSSSDPFDIGMPFSL